jgi:hypothetical protein
MVDFIIEKFNEIVSKACTRYGQEQGVDTTKIQVLFRLGADAEVEYYILKEYVELQKVTFNNILNVRIDFKGYSMIVPPFIQKVLVKYSEELKVEPNKMSVICISQPNNQVVLCLYSEKTFVKRVNIEEEL